MSRYEALRLADPAVFEAIELEALQALQSSLSTGSSQLTRSLRPEIEGLTQSGLASIRSQAQSVLKQLQPPS